MNLLLQIFISYLTLYLVIWFHELGHSFFYSKYGCKENWLKVSVKPYLFFSTPSPVDEEKAKKLTNKQDLIISYGGIGVNLLLAFVSIVIIKLNFNRSYYIELFLYQFASLHLSEVISYLIFGNFYLVSDMKDIADIKPILRPINFAFGILVSVFYFMFIIKMPQQIFPIIISANLLVIICMGAGRIVFTYYHSKNTDEKSNNF